MSTTTYFRSVNFSSTTINYDLLVSDTNVRTAIKERLTWTDDELNDALASDGIPNMLIQIYCAGTPIIINNGIEQALTENAVWSSGDYLTIGVKSIKIKNTGINGTFRFNIL